MNLILNIVVVLIISNYNTSAMPWLNKESNNYPNTFVFYFPDDFEQLKQEEQKVINDEMRFRPEIPTSQLNYIDYAEQTVNGVDVGDRTSLTTPSKCPVGTIYYNGKCRSKWNRG